MFEKYSIIFIENLEEKIETDLLPAALNICRIIEKEGKKKLQEMIEQHIKEKCPIKRCMVLEEKPEKCPNPLCWIAEGPSWQEFLSPEIASVYSLLMDTYLEALDIPEDPDEEATLVESPIDVMERKIRTEETQKLIIGLFEKSEFLKHRKSIIEDIIWAHTQKRYTLSVPLLIIQIEGILHDLAYHLKMEFEEGEMYTDSAKVWAIIKRLEDEPFKKALTEFYSGPRSPRNLILHGRFLEYGNDHRLSIVLFLILLYLVAFLQLKLHMG